MRTPLTHTPDASPSHRRPALVASPIGRSTSLGARRRQRQRRQQQPQRHPRTPTFLAPVQALPTILAAGGQLRISTLGLGTWSWGNRFLYGYDPESQDQGIAEAFAAAAEAGVTLWDSADSYGTGALSGRAESLLGQFLCDRSLCSQAYRERQVVAATKIAPYPWRITGKMFESAAAASVRRLSGTGGKGKGKPSSSPSPLLLPASRVVIQLHWSAANYAPPQEAALWDGLSRCYDSGLCSAVGVSNFGPRQLEKISKFLAKKGIPLAVAQNQYSLLSCGPSTGAAIAAARDAGAVPLAYSPLALGMLSGRYSVGRKERRKGRGGGGAREEEEDDRERRRRDSNDDIDDADDETRLPAGPRGVLFKQILPGARVLLDAIDAVAAETKLAGGSGGGASFLGGLLSKKSTPSSSFVTPAQVAVAWCVAKKTVPIPGARTAGDVRSHVAAATMRLPAGAVEELDAAARRVERGMTTNVFQTR